VITFLFFVIHGYGAMVRLSLLNLQTLTSELLQIRSLKLGLTKNHCSALSKNMLYFLKRIISQLDQLDGLKMVSQANKGHFIAQLEQMLHMEEQSLMLTTRLAYMQESKYQV
jgi:hypothetical protein